MSRELVLATDVQATPEDLYAAITTTDGLASFWTPQVTAEGRDLRLGFEPAPDDQLGSVTFTWALVLQALKGYAETGRPQPALR